MRPAITLLVFACAMLAACSSEEAAGPTSPPTASPASTPPDTDCGLGAIPSSTRIADLSWNGWEPEYTTNYVAEEIIGADAIIRGRVLKEVRVEVPTGFNQLACIWVEEVYHGRVTPGTTIVAGWPAPFAIDEINFDNRIGYRDGADYILLLGKPGDGYNHSFPAPVDYLTWLRDVYPLDLSGPGAASSQQAIDDLIAMVQGSPDISGAVAGLLVAHGLEPAYGIAAQHIEFPQTPSAPGTLTPPASSDFLWRTNYNRIRDAITAGGYDWSAVTDGPAFSISTRVHRTGVPSNGITVEADFVARNGVIVAGYLIGQSDAWTLDQFDAASVEEASSPPQPPDRAPSNINLASWFGVDTITAVRYKGGDARLTDGSFATPESLQKLIDSLNRDFQTHPTAGDDVNPSNGCAGTNLFIELSSGWTASLTYHSTTNRLYAIDDGFYVDAPRSWAYSSASSHSPMASATSIRRSNSRTGSPPAPRTGMGREKISRYSLKKHPPASITNDVNFNAAKLTHCLKRAKLRC